MKRGLAIIEKKGLNYNVVVIPPSEERSGRGDREDAIGFKKAVKADLRL